jgi:hypothetical protein
LIGFLGVETISVNAAVVSGVPALSIPNRFFDSSRLLCQHDESLIDRHRQDDPTLLSMILADKLLAVAVGDAVVILNALTIMH